MTKSRIINCALLAVSVCLAMAWFGATEAAGRERGTASNTSPADEELRLLKSDAESVIVQLSTPSFEVLESTIGGVVYYLIAVPGCGQTDDVGKPQLPVRGTLLGIPSEAEYSLRVLEVEEETLPGRYNIYSAPQPVMERDGEGNPLQMAYVPARDERLYSSNAFYPDSVAELGSAAFIRDQRVLQLRFLPFQYNPASGQLMHNARIRIEVQFHYPYGQPRLYAASTGDESFKDVLQNAVLNYDSARGWRVRPSRRDSGTLSLGQVQPECKVLADEDGIYQLTYADLVSAGMELESVHPDDFELYNLGQEVAIRVVDEDEDGQFKQGDYILFYGQQMTTTYTYTNVYWLGTGEGDGLRMQEKDGTLGASTVLTHFNTSIRWEEDVTYNPHLPEPEITPNDEEMDHWFAGFLRNPPIPSAPQAMDVFLELPELALTSPPYSVTLRGDVNGKDTAEATGPYSHSVGIYLNGDVVHEGLWPGEGAYEFEETDIPHTVLVSGENTVTVECLLSNPSVAAKDVLYVDWLELDYQRTYSTENGPLFFDGDEEGTWQYSLPGFLTSTVKVFDITDPFSVTHFLSTTVEQSGTYTVKFQDSISHEHHYLALTPSQYRTPVVVEDDPSSLRSTSNGADYIIITHPDFEDAVLRLRDHRLGQGLRVEVVDVRDVYDEFSYGVFNPRALRDFLRYAYENWVSPPPSYVLLVGDGNYDFEDHEGKGEPNYVPSYLIYAEPWWGETAADNRFVCVSGDDELPDLNLGRFPAQTASQVTAMVSKTIDYETSLPGGDWRQQVLFLADDPDNPQDPNSANNFWSLADYTADRHLPPAPLYTAQKVYYGVAPYTTLSSVRQALSSAFDTGRLFVNYVGHASVGVWGGYPHGAFLSRDDVAMLPSSAKTPMVMAMACLEGYFIAPSPAGSDSNACLAERLVRAEGKGSVANWSPTSEGMSSRQHYLHVGFYDAVFRGGVEQVGPAIALAKLHLFQNTTSGQRELIDTYVLFGDPALELPIERTYMAFLPLGLKGY